ncbi:MAG: hypothetical protein MPJ25_01625, partial [Pirellulales bacterium]|nr:hypothetical protein [Pirellulales bacterium]
TQVATNWAFSPRFLRVNGRDTGLYFTQTVVDTIEQTLLEVLYITMNTLQYHEILYITSIEQKVYTLNITLKERTARPLRLKETRWLTILMSGTSGLKEDSILVK